MKKLLIASLLFFCFHVQAMEDKWLKEKIKACKDGEDDKCFFLAQYITSDKLMLCKRQGKSFSCLLHSCNDVSESQEEKCKLLTNALTDEVFIVKFLAEKK